MAQTRTASIFLAAASATAICTAQTPAAAGSLTINGSTSVAGVAVLDVARRVLITTVANESAKTFTVIGTDRGGNSQGESFTGPNATSFYSVFDYATVTKITVSAATTGAITFGTNTVASTRWMELDTTPQVFNISAGVNFGGNAGSVAVEFALDDFQKSVVDSLPTGNGDSSLAGLFSSKFNAPIPFQSGMAISGDTMTQYTAPARAVRITTISGGTVGAIRLSVLQQGL